MEALATGRHNPAELHWVAVTCMVPEFMTDAPMDRLVQNEAMLREAAHLAREDLLTDGADAGISRQRREREVVPCELRVKSCARALWGRNAHVEEDSVRLATALDVLPHPRRLGACSCLGAARARLGRGYTAWVGAVHRAGRASQEGARSSREAVQKIKAGARRVAQMWRPEGLPLNFSTVIIEATTERAHRWSMRGVRLPECKAMEVALRRAPWIAPGRDGIPCKLCQTC